MRQLIQLQMKQLISFIVLLSLIFSSSCSSHYLTPVDAAAAERITSNHPTGTRGGVTRNGRKLEGPTLSFPSITRDLHPEPLELKAHSGFDLKEKEEEIFIAIEEVLTPYLKDVVPSGLIAYDLKVEYSEGEETAAAGIVITNILVTCVVTVRSDSIQSLKALTHEKANLWLIEFFDGSNIYKILGKLDDENIQINEIVFQDDEFRSPLLNGGKVISGVKSDRITGGGGSGSTGKSTSSGNGGMIAGAFAGVVIVCSVLLVKYRDRLPWNEVRDMSFGGSDSSSGSSSGGSGSGRQFLIKTFGRKSNRNAFRRSAIDAAGRITTAGGAAGGGRRGPPMSEVIPISANPHNPFDFGESRSERTQSVGGDFDITDDYDFSKKSPSILSYYSYGTKQANTPRRDPNSSDYDEFSMPDEYNTVTDEYSVHCHSILGLQDDKSTASRSTANGGYGPPPSPYYNDLDDEWSFMEGYSVASSSRGESKEGSKSKLNIPSLL